MADGGIAVWAEHYSVALDRCRSGIFFDCFACGRGVNLLLQILVPVADRWRLCGIYPEGVFGEISAVSGDQAFAARRFAQQFHHSRNGVHYVVV